MVKKGWAVLLALVLVLLAGAACADSLRHEVHGDVSELEASESLSSGRNETPVGNATVGTDVYLYVDPYSASYVTFEVVDEWDNPIHGAAIYLSYGGHTEFYGLTDVYGKFSSYIFRDTEYGYRVECFGYMPESGTFIAAGETKTVRVVLRKYYSLDVVVLNNGAPVPGVRVEIDANDLLTGADGSARFYRPNGLYTAKITLPDGTVKFVTIRVAGDTVYVVDIGRKNMPDELADILDAGGGYSDGFIVFDKYYAPEDYDLTEKIYTDEEFLAALGNGMTQEQQAAALAAWHAQRPDVVHIVAEPDKTQATPDRIITVNGKPRYSQRSLILSGAQLLNIEQGGAESILFENEHMGVWLDIADLYSPDMAKLFGLIRGKRANESAYRNVSLYQFDVSKLDFGTLPAVRRWMDEPDEKITRELTRAQFAASRLEVRITPLIESEIEQAVQAIREYRRVRRVEMDEVELISAALEEKWMAEYLADGCLTETEYEELENLLLCGRAYRVQVYMLIDGREVNVTDLLPSLIVRMDVNDILSAQAQAYAQAQPDGGDPEAYAHHVQAYRETLYPQSHAMTLIRNQGIQYSAIRYHRGDAVREIPVVVQDGLPGADEPLAAQMLSALAARRLMVFDVDVRRESYVHKDVYDYRYYGVVTIHRGVQESIEPDDTVCFPQALSGAYFIREE